MLPDQDITDAIDFEHGMSVSREKYCQSSTDALWTSDGMYFSGNRVLEFAVRHFEDIEHDHSVMKNTKWTTKVTHKPSPCHFPHSAVDAVRGGKVVDDVTEKKNRLTY